MTDGNTARNACDHVVGLRFRRIYFDPMELTMESNIDASQRGAVIDRFYLPGPSRRLTSAWPVPARKDVPLAIRRRQPLGSPYGICASDAQAAHLRP